MKKIKYNEQNIFFSSLHSTGLSHVYCMSDSTWTHSTAVCITDSTAISQALVSNISPSCIRQQQYILYTIIIPCKRLGCFIRILNIYRQFYNRTLIKFFNQVFYVYNYTAEYNQIINLITKKHFYNFAIRKTWYPINGIIPGNIRINWNSFASYSSNRNTNVSLPHLLIARNV